MRSFRSKCLKYGLLMVAGTVTGLILAEIAVRMVIPWQRLAVVSNLYRVSPDREVGYTLQPNFDGHAFGVPFTTNRFGYRGPDRPSERGPGVVRVALIGDSHAFGVGVDYDRTMGQRLAAYLAEAIGKPVETLNFALSGYNTRQELAVFRSLALRFAPTLVILVPCNNDTDPALQVDDHGFLQSASPGGVVRPQSRSLGMRGEMKVRSVLSQSGLFMLANLALLEFRHGGGSAESLPMADEPTWMVQPVPDVPVPDEVVRLVMSPLRDMILDSKARGISVILAPFAAPADYRRMFRDLATEQDVPLVELLGRDVLPGVLGWGQVQRAFGLGWDSHLNAEAHDRWAQVLARTAIEQGLVPMEPSFSGAAGSGSEVGAPIANRPAVVEGRIEARPSDLEKWPHTSLASGSDDE